MAYPAVNSLIQTVNLIQTTYPTLTRGQTAEMINSLHASAEYFQNILENISHQKHEHEKIKDMEEEMRVVVQQVEDLLESNIVELMIGWSSQQEEKNNTKSKLTIQDEAAILLRDLPQAIDKIDAIRKDMALVESSTFAIKAKAVAEEHSFKNRDSSSTKRASTTFLQDSTVGLDDALMEITDRLLRSASEQEVVPIWGMGGCGKTTLAKKVLDDPSIKSRFDIQVCVTISQEYHLREVLLSLVSGLSECELHGVSNDDLMEEAYRALKGKKYLIVIDDIWSTKIWDLIARTFPDDKNGSRIILTTRLKEVAEYVNPDIPPHEMMLLSPDESWKLLCHKLFGAKKNCPLELEEIGKKIVRKCQGLPLAILVVAGHLTKVPTTKDSWDAVAKNVSEVVTSYPNECLDILAMSYHHLPIHLKPCFLHIGLFPEDSDINIHRLIRLWVAERFLKRDRLKSPEEVAEDCLEDLISRNLIIVRRRKSNGKAKTFGIHDLLRDLSVTEAQKEKFVEVHRINQAHNFSATNLQSPRLSSHAPISLDNFSQSSQVMHSLYLFDEPHKPAKKTLQLKALRVLSVFPPYKFHSYPQITINYAIVRYLEIESDDQFCKSLPFMYNLETFIFFDRKIGLDEILTLPMQIWDMKHLRYLHIFNRIHLPNPPSMPRADGKDGTCDLGLQNLQELSRLCHASCTKEVFIGLPNLRKLKICDTSEVKSCKDKSRSLLNLVYLNKLDVFTCILDYSSFNRLKDDCSFPISLKKLNLSICAFPWEDMATLAKLPNLQVLRLRNEAFTGKEWKLNDEDRFNQLKFLMLDNLDLEKWEADSINFPILQRLVLQKCYCEIPQGILDICTLESIEFYSCHVSEHTAKEIQEEVAAIAGTDRLVVRTYCAYYDTVKKRL